MARYSENPSEQEFWDVKVGERLWIGDPLPIPVDENSLVKLLSTSDPDLAKKSEMREWCLTLALSGLEARGFAADRDNQAKMARAISTAMQNASVRLARSAQGDYGPDLSFSNSQLNSPLLGHGARTGKAVSFDSLFEGWAAEKSPGAKTRYSWERVLKQLAGYLKHNDAAQLSADNLVAWKASLVAAGLKTKTIRDGKLAPVRAILQWGVDNRLLVQNPGERVTIDLKTKPLDRKRGYSDEEAIKVLKASLEQTDTLRRWVT